MIVASESELLSFTTFVAWSWSSTSVARRESHTEGVVSQFVVIARDLEMFDYCWSHSEGVVSQFVVIASYFGKL